MKSIKTLLCGGLVCLLATTSCISDQENYRAGFPVIGARHAYVYANNLVDSFRLVSYGPWRIDMKSNDGNWCSLAQLSGKGYTDYTFGVTFSENTTGHSRTAIFSVTDTEHTDISANFGFLQYATRGDGSMGNAAEVRSIKGSDGTAISLTYDRLHRPLTLGDIAFQRVAYLVQIASVERLFAHLGSERHNRQEQQHKGYKSFHIVSSK
jgi:hypothetical protein